MRKKSTYIILIAIIIVFGVVMFLLFGVENIKQGSYSSTLIVGDNTIWTYSNKKWMNITTNSSIEKLNWQSYKVYSNNKYLGEYKLWHDDKWYAFDDENNAVDIDGDILAYSANFSVKVLDYEEEDITVDSYVKDVLSDNDLSVSSKFTSSYKTSVDFDSDGVNEDFYLISNAFPNDFDPEYIFSIVFMVKDNQIYYIYNDISANRSFNGCKPYFNSFIDTNDDGVYEMILSCGRYSVSEVVDMLYSYSDDGFQILISNQ